MTISRPFSAVYCLPQLLNRSRGSIQPPPRLLTGQRTARKRSGEQRVRKLQQGLCRRLELAQAARYADAAAWLAHGASVEKGSLRSVTDAFLSPSLASAAAFPDTPSFR